GSACDVCICAAQFQSKGISLNYFECTGSKRFNAFNLTYVSRDRETSSTEPWCARTLQQSVLLDSGSSCFNFSIFMLRCVADLVSPLKIRMNFSQTEMLSGNSVAVLDVHSRTEENVEVPFQRNCNSNNSCVADLKLNFSFTNNTLVVENQAHFTVQVSLANPGDDSYNTSIVLHYPEGISLSKFDAIK
ncbi:hypothetical protein cypCar_00048393, partial [Cyprinus carpio]